MKKNTWILLGIILLVAAVLRFWQLGNVPLSPDWDEVSLGYNAYSIMHTGHDEYNAFLPIVLRSFGDYKPALYTYLCIPTIYLFGLTVFAIRFPSALIGTFTIAAVFLLIYELTKKTNIALLTSFFLAISPWHVQFSRVAFESNVGLAFNIFGVLFFIKGLKKPWFLSLTALFFALSLYVYQSEKVFTPLLALILVVIYRKIFFALPKKYLTVAIIIGVFIAFPIVIYTTTNKAALSRANAVSIFSQRGDFLQKSSLQLALDKQNHDYLGMVLDNRRVVYIKSIVANYLAHFEFNWLFLTGDINRHHAPNMGILYLVDLPFVLIGMYLLLFGKFEKQTKIFLFSWFLLAPIPATITTGVPHALRTLNFLPTFQFFTAVGVLSFLAIKHIRFRYFLYIVIFCLFTFNISYYIDQYFNQTNYYYADDWQYGFEQIVNKTKQVESNYNSVVVSNVKYLDQSYIFFLFYMKYDPRLYNNNPDRQLSDITKTHNFDKFVFKPINWTSDKKIKTLYIGNPEEFPSQLTDGKILYKVTDPSGKIVMEMAGT